MRVCGLGVGAQGEGPGEAMEGGVDKTASYNIIGA